MSLLPPGYELIHDREHLDPVATHAYLARSYWSPNIPFETVARAMANSLCVAVRKDGEQVGMARVVTDRATFAFLADVYVLEEHRGLGLARAMIGWLQQHADLRGLRRWLLMTLDAHSLYETLGWTALAHPERGMERYAGAAY